MKVKIEINDNLHTLLNYIGSALEPISFNDLVQFSIDFECYKEFYINLEILDKLRIEKNAEVEERMRKEQQRKYADTFTFPEGKKV